MENFDKQMAISVIEDAMKDLDTPYGCGLAAGLCGAFYMCGLLSEQEWKAYLQRIPSEFYQGRKIKGAGIFLEVDESGTSAFSRLLN